MHAIGDRAVREGLDAVEAAHSLNRGNNNRHHIAHIQVVNPADVPRFGRLQVIANAQPLWACSEPQMTELTLPFLGPERSQQQYPFRSLLRHGSRLAFGSDWPVSTPNPMEIIHVAVNRTPPGQPEAEAFLPHERLTLEAAIEAHTFGSAYVNHDEKEAGTITVGKRADLVVIDQDLFTIPSAEIYKSRVTLTMVDGSIVYRS
jgi:predicted amidohydrolase YtcJ